jgi:hypothetical protein
MNQILKITGIIIIAAGILLTFRPELVSPAASQITGYELIEKRVRWGLLIGTGILLCFFQHWGHWRMTVWATLAALSYGIIIARLIGSFLDGFFIKQFYWLVIELILAAVFTWLYWRLIRP